MTSVSDRSEPQGAGIKRTLLIWILALIALILGLFVANLMSPLTTSTSLSREELLEIGYFAFPAERQIASFELLDHHSQPINNSSLIGGWSLLFFGFTFCPDVCPTTLAVLSKAHRSLQSSERNQVSIMMVSVDPERDTPERLAAYVTAFDQDFVGVTGDVEQIAAFASSVHVAFGKVPGPDAVTYSVNHSSHIVVINPAGNYAGFLKAPHSPENVIKVLNSLVHAGGLINSP